MILIVLGCAWLAGMLLGSCISVPLPLAGTGIIPFLTLPFLRRHRKYAVLAGLSLILLFSGAWYYRVTLSSDTENSLARYNDTGTVELRGTVARYPERKNTGTRFHFQADAVKIDGKWQDVSGTALIFVPFFTGYDYGDELLLEASLHRPQKLDDFDYETYLAVKGIYAVAWNPHIEILSKGKGAAPVRWMYAFRNGCAGVIGRVIPEPQASLVTGILLGMKGGIQESTRQAFSITGTSHILAISGLHLGIIAGIAVTLGLRIFGRRGFLYVWLALAVIWLYALLSGMNPPVVRAAIMVTLYLAAEFFGRQRGSLSALVIAAAVMAGCTPRLLWDASFQMSFAAMAGLIFLFPPIQSLGNRLIPERFHTHNRLMSLLTTVIDSLGVSAAAVCAVWPLTAGYFGVISPAGALATFVTLPALPVIIFSGLLCGAAGLLFLPLGQVIGWIAWLAASWILLAVDLFSKLPALESVTVRPVLIIVYYACLLGAAWYVNRKLKNTETEEPAFTRVSLMKDNAVIVALSVLAVFSLVSVASMPDRLLHVSFLDIGQGDAILISKGTRQILVDGGPTPDAVMVKLGEQMPFWDRTIDLVILTHPDADHLTGLLEVIARYRVGQVACSDIGSDSLLYHRFCSLLEEKNIGRIVIDSGDRITLGQDVVLSVFNPSGESAGKNIDNDSVVLSVTTGSVSFLLTGDIPAETEIALLSSRLVTKCTVLKVAHHGSSTSSSPEFLNVVRPDTAVISCGRDNPFGHPVPEVIDRLERTGALVYRTDVLGTIEYVTDGNTLRMLSSE
ncbi:MAG: DNA internalization-related competence protein ComEC/Rec2 [Dehalococcoidales bacterium]|nr:DNA internalization-related competence protein ComEC/Rec2 [Dehalococcoidales bacterium]